MAVPVALLLGVLATSDQAGTRAADSPLLGKPAPAIVATTVNGQPFDLAQYRGKWVLVNFFATWCVPCRQEHPDLVQFAARHQAVGDASVIGVVYDDSLDAVRGFLQKEGGTWPMAVDPKSRIALDFGVSGVPESYLITPGGAVAAKIVGGVQASALEDLLSKVKAGTPPGA